MNYKLKYGSFLIPIFSWLIFTTTTADNIPRDMKREELPGPAFDLNFGDFKILQEGHTFSGLFTQPIAWSELQEFYNYRIQSRRGDAFVFNGIKFITTLLEFCNTLREGSTTIGTTVPLIRLHSHPLDRLGLPCELPGDTGDLVDHLIVGGLRETDFVANNSSYVSKFPSLCTPPGYIPLLRCIGKRVNDNYSLPLKGTCQCSIETVDSRWTSLAYVSVIGAEGTPDAGKQISCVGHVGAFCDGLSLACSTGLICQKSLNKPNGPSYCGGELGSLARGFGGGIRFTDEQLSEVLRRRKFKDMHELEGYLIRVSNSLDIIGHDCDPMYWNWAAHSLLPFISLTNDTSNTPSWNTIDFFLNNTKPIFAYMNQYYLASVLKEYNWLSENPELGYYNRTKLAITLARAEHYDFGDRCLNEFPRMACVQKRNDPQRGACKCATSTETGSRIFNYFEQDGQCVGKEGTVCTTMRGSGEHACAVGLICESPYADRDKFADIRAPLPFAHHIMKVCMKPQTKRREKNNTDSKILESDSSMVKVDTLGIFMITTLLILHTF